MTASPMNFSTVPPCRSTIVCTRSKYRAIRARSASGSIDSPSAVEPARSQKRDGDGLALLLAGLVTVERSAALGAEPERSFRLEAATRTCGHAASLGVSEGDDDVSRSSAGTSGT